MLVRIEIGTLGNVYAEVVEGDESFRRSLPQILRAARMQPSASTEEFRADEKQPRRDCLVLDVLLPGRSGVDLRNQLAAVSVATPVLFVTALADPRAREGAVAGRA